MERTLGVHRGEEVQVLCEGGEDVHDEDGCAGGVGGGCEGD